MTGVYCTSPSALPRNPRGMRGYSKNKHKITRRRFNDISHSIDVHRRNTIIPSIVLSINIYEINLSCSILVGD